MGAIPRTTEPAARRRTGARVAAGLATACLALPLMAGIATAAPSAPADPCNPQSSAPCSGPNVDGPGGRTPADHGEAQPEDEVSNELAACGVVYLPCAAGSGVYDTGKGLTGLR